MAAYLIANVEVTDQPTFDEYRKHTPAVVEKFGGKFVVRGGETTLLEGQVPPHRCVVVEFPSMEQAKAFYESEDYAPLLKMRLGASNSRAFLVEGA